MLKFVAIGAGLAFAAAVQPGPLQAYLFARVTASGWRRTLPASFAPLLSDGPIAILALVVFGRLSPDMQGALRLAGGLVLLFLGWKALRRGRRGVPRSTGEGDRVPRSLLEATLVNILNPNPYIGWTLILGPNVVAAWREAPAFGVAVVAAFYTTMVLTLAVLIVLFGATRYFAGRSRRMLAFASALILVGLGCYQLVLSLRGFGLV